MKNLFKRALSLMLAILMVSSLGINALAIELQQAEEIVLETAPEEEAGETAEETTDSRFEGITGEGEYVEDIAQTYATSADFSELAVEKLTVTHAQTGTNPTINWTSGEESLSGSLVGGYKADWAAHYYYAGTSTITLKNNYSNDAVLTFSYSVTLTDSDDSVTIDETTKTGTGIHTVLLDPDGTCTVKLEVKQNSKSGLGLLAGDVSPNGASVNITGITLVERQMANVTFTASEGGTYTVDGTAVGSLTNPVSKESTEDYVLAATPNSGYSFAGWYNATTGKYISSDASYTTKFNGTITVTAKFIPTADGIYGVGDARFTDFNVACQAAAGSSVKTVVLLKDATLAAGNYTVPAGVTFLVPFDDAYTLSTTRPEYHITNGNAEYLPVKQFRTLTMQSGANITVNGAICVNAKNTPAQGSKLFGGCTVGDSGFIVMNSGSKIDLNKGSSLYAWGYIVGSGTVDAKSGSSVYENMQIADFCGGSALLYFYVGTILTGGVNNIFPFSQYHIQNVEVPLRIYSGAQHYGLVSLYMSDSNQTADFKFIGDSSSLFCIKDGYVEKDYDGTRDRQVIDIYGNAALSSVVLSVDGQGINTADMDVVINNNMDITLKSGYTLDIGQDIILQPEANITIENNATVNIASGINAYVYDASEWGQYIFNYRDIRNPAMYAYERTITDDCVLDGDATVDVNGTINVYGQFFTTTTGANIKSSGKTGVINFKTAPTESSSFKQARGSGRDNMEKINVAVTAPQLKNGRSDYPYTPTVGSAAGNVYNYCPTCDVWYRDTYTVSFNAGENGTGTMENIHVHPKVPYDVPENKFSRAGHSFNGWSAVPAESAALANGKYTFSSNVTLTALWEPNTYTVKWVNGNTTLYETTGKYGTVPTLIEIETPTKEMDVQYIYTFAGWDADGDDDMDVAAGEAFPEIAGDTTYSAWYQKTTRTYPITWINEDGTELYKADVAYGTVPEYKGDTPTKASTKEFNYTHSGWTTEVVAVTGPATYTAAFSSEKVKYQINWKDGNGVVIKTDSVEYGAIPSYTGDAPTKNSTEKYEYTFDGTWSPEIVAVTDTATYTANFTANIRSYTVTWKNGDEITTETYKYGDTPTYKGETPEKEADPQFTYTFKDWGNVGTVTGDVTYTANFEPTLRSYKITFLDYDGTELGHKYVAYDAQPSFATPTREATQEFTYTFAGWDPEVVEVTGPATYTATYTQSKVKYAITWLDGDGNNLKTVEVEYGETPAYSGETPTKKPTEKFSYEFNGTWSPEIVAVTGAATYTANFTETTREYPIGWDTDGDGDINETTDVAYGTVPTAPEASKPTTPKYTYTFDKWTPEVVAVTGATTYKAIFTETVNQYTIKFVDWNDVELQSSEVAYGETPAYTSEAPVKEGHTFKGWDKTLASVTGDATYKAVYEINKYEVKWIVDGNETTETYEHGATPSFKGSTDKAADAQYTYTFKNWSPAIVTVTGDATYTAQYDSTVNSYTITWVDGNGEPLKTDTLEYGKTPSYSGDTPTKKATTEYTYTFNNAWSPAIVPVAKDATYTAEFTATKNSYTITWKNDDGSVIDTTTVEYGKVPTHANAVKEADDQYTYTFDKWAPEVVAVTGEATYTATYTNTTNKYTVTWKNGDTVLKTEQVEYGTVPAAPSEPTKNADAQYTYAFAGWDADGDGDVDGTTSVTGNTTYSAVFTPTTRTYTVTWIVDGKTSAEEYEYNATPSFTGSTDKAADKQYTYTFAGWDKEIAPVTGNATYTATYSTTVNKYTITWKNDDGSVIDTTTVEYGKVPTHADAVKDADDQYTYTFDKWAPEVVAVTGDATYTATYTNTTNKYTVTWKNGDTILKTEQVEYGTVPTAPNAPSKEATAEFTYAFAGWDNNSDGKDDGITPVTGNTTYSAVFTQTTRTYTVTWIVDGNETTETYAYGATPNFTGSTNKAADAQYTYTFTGWYAENHNYGTEDALPKVTDNVTYTATYSTTVNKYTISWDTDGDGDIDETTSVEYGTVPTHADPSKDATAEYTYTFNKWTPEVVAVTGDATYTAEFIATKNSYTVTWIIDGVETEETYKYGETPAHADPVKKADAQYTYTFAGWDPEVVAVTGEATYTAQFDKTVNKYTITWVDGDGKTLKTEEVAYGETPVYSGETPTKARTDKFTYTFKDWGNVVAVTGDATYTAQFDEIVNEYTITWVDGDGKTLKTEQVAYGETPAYTGTTPTKDATAQYSYTFNNTWAPAIESVTKDATYTAQFDSTVNKYTVTWVVDGNTLETDTVEYGTIASYDGSVPEKSSDTEKVYTFEKWEDEAGNVFVSGETLVTGNVTYTAKFSSSPRSYTITWLDDESKLIDTTTVEYGTVPAHEAPSKAPTAEYTYTFNKWTPELAAVTGDATYRATYTATKNSYTITWLDDEGELIDTTTVEYGTIPTHAEPTKAKTAEYTYTFAGWDVTPVAVTGDATYKATFTATKNSYTISWDTDGDGDIDETTSVEYGTVPTAPTASKDATAEYTYTFAGWDVPPVAVTGNATYKATFTAEKNSYTVTWVIDGKETEETYEYGKTPVHANPVKAADAQYTYTFAGWDPVIGMVTGDATYTAQFDKTVNEYTITWVDGDGKTLKTEKVAYGETPAYTGATPTKDATVQYSYTFNNTWTPAIEEVTGPATYIAQFDGTVNEYTIKFVDENGEELQSGKVAYDDTPVYGKENPVKEGYTFTGWDADGDGDVDGISSVTGDKTYTAVYEINKYTVTWKDWNGTVIELDDKNVEWGTAPSYNEDVPTRTGYTFTGWKDEDGNSYDSQTSVIKKDTVYTAEYSPNTYNVYFYYNEEDIGKNEGLYYETKVVFGEAYVLPENNPAIEGKTFTQWLYESGSAYANGDKHTVANDVNFYANWGDVYYSIKWFADGKQIGEGVSVTYETDINKDIPTAPEKEGHTFTGWKDEKGNFYALGVELPLATESMNYTAEYAVNTYKVTFKVDGKVEETVEVKYGEAITVPQYTAPEGYTFSGWKNIPATMPAEDLTFEATLAKIIYTISWDTDGDGKVDTTTDVEHGENPIAPDAGKSATAEYTYTFDKWDPEIKAATENTTYTAEFTATKNSYTISWDTDGDGDVDETTTVEYGTVPTHAEPTKAKTAEYTYTFAGWDETPVAVTGNATYKATFTATKNSYTVTWVIDGKETEETYEYGTVPTHADPSKDATAEYTYTFNKWTPEVVAVTGDATYTAEFTATKNSYTITWLNDDDTLIDTTTVEYGTVPTHAEPTKAKTAEYTYTFAGWDETPVAVTGDATYKATFTATKNSYTITWVDGNGDTLYSKDVLYGETPAYTGATPTKDATAQYSYTFNNTWAPAIESVTKDATYTAQFDSTVNKYTVTWIVDGTETTEEYEYDAIPKFKGTPVKGEDAQYTYTFDGWDKTILPVTGDVTYTAKFEPHLRSYTIIFRIDAENTISTMTVGYGATPTAPADPFKSSDVQYNYTFAGWDVDGDGKVDGVSSVTGPATYTAVFNKSLRSYSVVFVDEDGETVLKEAVSYAYGTKAEEIAKPADPTKAATDEFTYEFAGWNPVVSDVTGNAVYKATYNGTKNSYTISWDTDGDGDVDETTTVEYGTVPTHADPEKAATAEYTYTFAGWDIAPVAVTGNATYKATFTATKNSYTITWKNDDGSVIDTTTVEYGTVPTHADPSKDATAEYTYTFNKWTPEVVAVTGDATYEATYTETVNEYTVTWIVDGNKTTETYKYGETPNFKGSTDKAADDKYTYTFDGWDKEISKVTGNVTYTAQYENTVNEYTITFVDWNDEVIQSEKVPYGTVPTVPSAPSREATAEFTYKFDKWTPTVVAVTGEATYKATYTETLRSYTVTWVNYDGNVIETDPNVPYGTMAEFNSTEPTRTSTVQYNYVFEGWDKEISEVTGDVTYTAVFNESVRSYSVVFVDEDGKTVLKEAVSYAYGTKAEDIVKPADPTKAATDEFTYEFAGWNPVVSDVTGNAVYKATYNGTKNSYTVTWVVDGNETTETYEYGTNPSFKGSTDKAPDAQYTYTHSGWTPAIERVTGDATYTATYSTTVNKYTVTWKNYDGKVIETDTNIPYGTMAEFNSTEPTRTSTVQYNYVFEGWDKEISKVTGDVTYTAVFNESVRSYSVVFVDEDGKTVLKEAVSYAYGTKAEDIVKPADPTKAATDEFTFTFAGWDPVVSDVTGNAVYKATYNGTKNSYTVTWVVDGNETTEIYEYGTNPSFKGSTDKAPDAQYTYTHSGWTPAIERVTGDATYTATYSTTVNKYTVIWKNYDGKVIETDTNVPYGTMAEFNSADPTKPADAQYTYTFDGWDKEISKVTGDVTYTATFTESVNEYTIRFVDWDNKELQSGKVPYGTVPTAPSDPFRAATAQYTYTFEGWDKEIVSVTGEATYKATYTETVNKYTVKFVDENGTTILDEQTLAYGETPVYGKEDPVKEGHIFKGWDKTFASVTGDVTYTAVYEINRYSVTWQDEDGTVIEPDKNVAWGTTPVYNSLNPTKTGHTFIGWKDEDGNFYDNASSIVTGDIVYTAVYEINRYTVTWTDENGNELEKDENVPYGTVPTFDKEIPEKAATAQYTYTFRGWRNVKTTEETEAGKDLPMVTDNVTYRILYQATVNKYTVTWVNEDGKELYKEEEVSYGITPTYKGETPTKEATAQYTFTHSGWTPEVSSVTGDITYTATYSSKVNTYSVTWMNGGSVAEYDASVPYGELPEYNGKVPAKPATAEFTYTFKGWTPAVSEVTGNITYNAEFTATVNEYTVKFVDENGTTLDEQVLPYGETPVYGGKTPEKAATAQYTYTFGGWDKDIAEVTGNVVYKATYTSVVNKYTVTWVGENDEIVETESVEYGSNASKKPAVPAKEGYTGRWEGDTNGITKDVTIKAVYQINSYKATFTINGEKYTEFNFVYGSKVTIPEYKVPEGHTFGGWNNVPETMPAKDITLDAVLTANVYKMTYTINGEVYKEFDVTYGTEVPVPEYEIPEGHTFTEWKDIPETMPAKDVVIDTTLTVNIYKVTYTKNGEFHADYEIAYGDPVYVPGYTVPEGYTFSGWTVPETMPAKDLVIDATETPNVYKVSFTINGEAYGETIEVTYGTKITVPEYNVPEGHTFGGWIVPDKMPAGDRTYDAVLTKNVYTVTFNLNGELYYEEQVTYGEPVTAPVYEGNDGYTFSGWNVPETMPAENIVLDATETINSYVLTFTINGEIYQQSEVEYRSRIRVPSYTVPEGHTFSGWNVPARATMPARDMTVDATLTVNTYTVTFTVNGEVYKEVEVTYGTEITAPEYEVPKGYVFSGWTEIPEKMPAEDITIDAELILNEFTVIFTVNGEKYSEISVVVGGVINAPEYEVPEGHTFGGWTVPEVMPAEDITLDAALTPNKYTVTFTVNGEAYGEAVEVTYGTAITVPEYEVPEGHTFSGWTVPETMPAENITLDAALTVNKYEITWVVDGEEIKTEVEFGKLPEFEGTPEKEADENFTYTFKEWDKEIVKVTGTATYTAVFTRTGWETSEDGKHYLVEDEIQKTGWTEIDGNWYYLDTESGVPATGNAYLPYNTELGYGPNDFDESYVPEEDEEAYPDSEKSWFVFDENGVFQSGLTGFHTLNGETVWAVNGELPFNVGLVSAGGEYYYFCAGRTMVTGDYHITRTNGIVFDNGAAAVEKGVYTFGADGKLIRYDGITEIDGTLYHYDHYRKNVGAGLIMIDGNFYYVRTSGALVVNTKYWVEKVNEFDYISVGSYEFDENGVMQITVTEKNGVYAEEGAYYYYENGVRTYKGLIRYSDGKNYNNDIIYVTSSGMLATGNYYVAADNGLIEPGYFLFDEFGRLTRNGIYEEDGVLHYYRNGEIQYGTGLIIYKGDYYYVRSNGALAVGNYWITNNNGLMECGMYYFDESGKLIGAPIEEEPEELKNGFYEENGGIFYYVNGKIQYSAGLVLIGGEYYYIRSNGQVAIGEYWITNTNGLMPMDKYYFDSLGRMTEGPEVPVVPEDPDNTKNGFYEENGGIFYYLNGDIQYGAGLIKVDDEYYYVRSNGQAATGRYWVTNNNGILPQGMYEFAEDGKMITE